MRSTFLNHQHAIRYSKFGELWFAEGADIPAQDNSYLKDLLFKPIIAFSILVSKICFISLLMKVLTPLYIYLKSSQICTYFCKGLIALMLFPHNWIFDQTRIYLQYYFAPVKYFLY